MKIEKRLRLLASQNSNYAPLLAQWEFDKRLLSRALNSVSNNFPHYSLHDESHSSTIINQIEKVISPNIELLSATDCWLLLEACYWHDSGMVINHKEKEELVSDAMFHAHLKQLSIENGELSKYAKSILEGIEGGNVEKLLADSQYLVFIIADYYRGKHAHRSEEHVNNPEKIGVHSPRTHLIPARLIMLLGSICSCHGKSSESILDLPKVSDGVDSEDYAHPRYVASLLRIGDLLDIDDGRFCETLLKNISGLPSISAAHKRKHDSVQHLYIDSRVVEIKSQCNDYESFAVQQAWFDYIQSEFDYQKRVWNEIVPSQDYISLPTVNNVSCEIKGYLTVQGKVPKITLDKERIYQYLTGSLIYKRETPYLREVVQNSIDAIHNKVWAKFFIDNASKNNGVEQGVSKRDEFNSLLEKERIDIKIERNGNGGKLTVCDTGIGMSIDDVGKIMNVGSRNKGTKQDIVSSMPDWAKPSGFFGIGFQSVFSVSDKVIIETKQDGEHCYQIEFNKIADHLPNIGIKEIKRRWFEGTNLEIYLDESGFNDISLIGSRPRGAIFYSEDDEDTVDPIITATYDSEKKLIDIEKKIRDEIKSIFHGGWVKIYLNGIRVDWEKRSYDFTDLNAGIDYLFEIENTKTKKLSVLFRGTTVEAPSFHSFLKGSVNVFGGDAGDWLTINRDGFRGEKMQDLYKEVMSGIRIYAKEIYDASVNKKIASLFLSSETEYQTDDWKDLLVNGVRLEDVYNGNAVIVFSTIRIEHDKDYYEFEGSEPNSLDVIRTFSNLAIKKGYVPVFNEHEVEGASPVVINKIEMKVVKERSSVKYTITPRLIEDNIESFIFEKTKRACTICYSTKYDPIAIKRDLLPESMFSFEYFSFLQIKKEFHPGCLLLPNKMDDNYFEDEMEIIYNYLLKVGVKVDRKIMEELYHDFWTEIKLCPLKKDETNTDD